MQFTLKQELIAEFLGTMILLLFGAGVVAMVVLFSDPANPSAVVNGGYTNITLGWGFAVLMGIFTAGTISGAHLNPAVTVALAATGRFSWQKVLPYIGAQVLGAFAGAALVFANYHPQWMVYDPTLSKSAGVLATFPAFPGFWSGFFDQVLGTALLMFLILAIGDKLNNRAGGAWGALAVAFVVMAIGMSFGAMNGYAINPARDFGPRLFALMAGFQNTGFENISVWTIPILGPLVGGVLGAFAYDYGIGKAIQQAKANAQQQNELN